MYCVSGWLIIGDDATSCSESGVRRQALGLSDPLRNAFAATVASVDDGIPWSCRYRCVFMAKNCVVSIRPVSPYQWPSPHASGSALNAPRGCLSKPIAIPRS